MMWWNSSQQYSSQSSFLGDIVEASHFPHADLIPGGDHGTRLEHKLRRGFLGKFVGLYIAIEDHLPLTAPVAWRAPTTAKAKTGEAAYAICTETHGQSMMHCLILENLPRGA